MLTKGSATSIPLRSVGCRGGTQLKVGQLVDSSITERNAGAPGYDIKQT